MLAPLRRHPFPVKAHFGHSAVLTYAVEPSVLAGLVPPGLVLDTYKGLGLLAIAMVQTTGLRPAALPAFAGQDFFLAGYRVFVKYHSRDGRTLRGLRILRSYTDRRLMVAAGNLLTHYNYRLAGVRMDQAGSSLRIRTSTPGQEADLDVLVDLAAGDAALPQGSPFETLKAARRFAGPLPHTFDYEQRTDSIIIIEGKRTHWHPRPVRVQVHRNTFIDGLAQGGSPPVLANAFHVGNVDYRWLRGRREPLAEDHHART